jgi:hypothetical protein
MKKPMARIAAATLAASALIVAAASGASAGTAQGKLQVKAPAGVGSIGAYYLGGDGQFHCIPVQAGQWKATPFAGDVWGRLGVYGDSACQSAKGAVNLPKDSSTNVNYWFEFKSSDIVPGNPPELK